MIVPALIDGRWRFVCDREAELLTAQQPVAIEDGATNFMRVCARMPVDSATFEISEPSGAIGSWQLVAKRISEDSRFGLKLFVLIQNAAMYPERAQVVPPVDNAVLKGLLIALTAAELHHGRGIAGCGRSACRCYGARLFFDMLSRLCELAKQVLKFFKPAGLVGNVIILQLRLSELDLLIRKTG